MYWEVVMRKHSRHGRTAGSKKRFEKAQTIRVLVMLQTLENTVFMNGDIPRTGRRRLFWKGGDGG